jgi:hypothetical protein
MGLKFILPELGDHLAFGDSFALLARLFDKKARYLECQVDAFRRFNRSRKGAHIRFISGRHDDGFDGTNQFGICRLPRRASNDETDC